MSLGYGGAARLVLGDGESAIYAYKCTNLRMSGLACFCGSDSLVVGNGTTHSNSRIAESYLGVEFLGARR